MKSENVDSKIAESSMESWKNDHAIRAATRSRLLKRSCESLIGLCEGLLADDILSDDEIHFLNVWLNDNKEIAEIWPGEVIYAKVRDVLADGVITEEERSYLKTTLSELLGGTFQDSGATSGLSTGLPIDKINSIEILDSMFCFTGNFIYGTRKACERAIIKRQGLVSKSVTMKLDYLVIGTMVSREWANTSFGRKIEKAVDCKNKGANIHIISEEQWIQFL